MALIDWSIILALLALMTFAAYFTKRYTSSVADFLAASRCAGRYMLGVGEGIVNIGAITVVAQFEAYYRGGFSFVWWGFLEHGVVFLVALTGWIAYRYRQTRALTMAQFFEMRYSRNFRVFAGIVLFISGTLNFAIFPAIGARFFIYFCGLPAFEVQIFDWFTIDLIYALIMMVLLGLALFFTFMGGQIAVIVTDFIQGTFFNIVFCVILAFIFVKLPWSQIAESLLDRPLGESMLHPFEAGNTKDFNFWFYLIQFFGLWYTWMAWQGPQGYYASALNPHEARMGRIVGMWRSQTQRLMIVILPICAFVLMHHSGWTNISADVNNSLSAIGDDTIRSQVTTTLVLARFLPIGLLGGFAAVMLAAFISTHDTYLHSWGSIFIQDIILPFRKKPLGTREHMNLLRWSIFGVAVFIFFFSLFFQQNDYVWMYQIMTGAIWLGGAGTVIVGGLYWKKGTTAGAYGAVILGLAIAVAGFLLQRLWPGIYGEDFPINAQWLWFIAILSSAFVYVVISLLGKKKHCDMDKLLHRGKYAVAKDVAAAGHKLIPNWQILVGIGRDFTTRDRVLYLSVFGFTILLFLIFIVGTICNAVFDVSVYFWVDFWHFYVFVVLIIGIVTTIWLTLGGLIDLKKMFRRLRTITRDEHDDGSVL